jgi:hypothetical protein
MVHVESDFEPDGDADEYEEVWDPEPRSERQREPLVGEHHRRRLAYHTHRHVSNSRRRSTRESAPAREGGQFGFSLRYVANWTWSAPADADVLGRACWDGRAASGAKCHLRRARRDAPAARRSQGQARPFRRRACPGSWPPWWRARRPSRGRAEGAGLTWPRGGREGACCTAERRRLLPVVHHKSGRARTAANCHGAPACDGVTANSRAGWSNPRSNRQAKARQGRCNSCGSVIEPHVDQGVSKRSKLGNRSRSRLVM